MAFRTLINVTAALVVGVSVSAFAQGAAQPAPAAMAAAEPAADAPVSKGEYLARAGNCVACHSIDGGQAFAGGLKMMVPMLGAIYTTNITPDKETGIGNYSLEDFDKAVRIGQKKDGGRMFPAMPYPSYAKLSQDDIKALYDFFMTEVKPVNQAKIPSEIPKWMDVRWAMSIWNVLFFDDKRFAPVQGKDAVWNRGAYLVEGAGHCGACHTPRGLAFQEKGMDADDSQFLVGAPLDNWTASNLTGDVNSGLGRWSKEDLVSFLKTGHNGHGIAFGSMVDVINNSTGHFTDADIDAMATYLKSLPPQKEKGAKPWEYNDAATVALKARKFDKPGSLVYSQQCAACHVADGKGRGEYQAALAGNAALLDPDASSLINLVLNGSARVINDGVPDAYRMPYFRVLLNDQQIADVITFISSSWGNNVSGVTAAQVKKVRDETDPLHNDIIVLRMK